MFMFYLNLCGRCDRWRSMSVCFLYIYMCELYVWLYVVGNISMCFYLINLMFSMFYQVNSYLFRLYLQHWGLAFCLQTLKTALMKFYNIRKCVWTFGSFSQRNITASVDLSELASELIETEMQILPEGRPHYPWFHAFTNANPLDISGVRLAAHNIWAPLPPRYRSE